MVMLLALAGGRVIGTGRFGSIVGWSAVCVFGLIPVLNAGALLALAVAWTAIAASRGLFGFLIGLALSLGLLYGVTTVSAAHEAIQAESVQFYRVENGGPAPGLEALPRKAAALGGLRSTQAVTGEEPDENGSLPLVGERSNVIFGVGPGLNYQKTIGAFYGNLDNPEKQEPDTYNLYLLLALQMGLAAAFGWAWLLFDGAASARQGRASLRDPDQRAFLLGVYGACLGLVVFSVYGTILVRGPALVLFTLLGVASRLLWQLTPPPAPKPKKAAPIPVPAPAEAVAESAPPVAAVVSEPLATAGLSSEASAASPNSAEPEAVVEESAPETGPLDLDAPPTPAAGPPTAAAGQLDWQDVDQEPATATPEDQTPAAPATPEDQAAAAPATPEDQAAAAPATPEDQAAAAPATPEDQAAAEADLQAWLKSEGLLDEDEDGTARE